MLPIKLLQYFNGFYEYDSRLDQVLALNRSSLLTPQECRNSSYKTNNILELGEAVSDDNDSLQTLSSRVQSRKSDEQPGRG
jgi:hypothetical protein